MKVTGQALAAVTTAGVGAVIGGTGGTVAGAALASVVTTVGDAFYQHSLKRTSERVRRLGARPGRGGEGRGDGRTTAVTTRAAPKTRTATTRAAAAGSPAAVAPTAGRSAVSSPERPTTAGPPRPRPDARPEVRHGEDGRTRVVPLAAAAGAGAHAPPPEADDSPTGPISVGGPAPTAVAPTAVAPTAVAPTAVAPGTRVMAAGGDPDVTAVVGAPGSDPGPYDDPDAPDPAAERPTGRPWRRYALLAATTVLVFLVAMVAITGIERVKGSPLSGGGSGTSVGEVFGTRDATPTATTAADEGDPGTTTSQRPTATGGASSSAAAPATTGRAPARSTTAAPAPTPTPTG